jgi:hypothetical protein
VPHPGCPLTGWRTAFSGFHPDSTLPAPFAQFLYLPCHCINPTVGAASWPRSRRRTALLQDGARTSLSVTSRINTPGCISSCKSPIEIGLKPRFYASIGLPLRGRSMGTIRKDSAVEPAIAQSPVRTAGTGAGMDREPTTDTFTASRGSAPGVAHRIYVPGTQSGQACVHQAALVPAPSPLRLWKAVPVRLLHAWGALR